MRLGDPKECRERAAYCAKQANTAASPLAREKFAHMAQVWLHLAIQLEEQWMLLDQWAQQFKKLPTTPTLTSQRKRDCQIENEIVRLSGVHGVICE